MSEVTSRDRVRIQRELDENPAWRVRLGRGWLCPFCLELVAREPDPELPPDLDDLDMVCAHLGLCLRFRGWKGRAQPLHELRRRAESLRRRDQLRRALVKRPSWQLYDVSRRWYCPFCAQATEVRVKEGGRISSSILRRIEEHLTECVAYDRGRGSERPAQVLRQAVGYANRTRKMAEQVRQKIESDAAWRLRDAEGRWVCPFCRRVLPHVDFSTSEQMLETAPLEISRHLVSECERFGIGRPGESRPAAPPVPSASEIDRLGRASNTEIIRLSGAPPIEVSGELGSVSLPPELEPPAPPSGPELRVAGDDEEPRAAAVSHPALDLGPALDEDDEGEEGGVWRKEISSRLAEVRSTVDGLAPPPGGELDREAPSEVEGLEVRVFSRPARSDPQDLLELVSLGRGALGLAIGTVSTDGSDGGIFLPMTRSFVKAHAKPRISPKQALVKVNQDATIDEGGQLLASLTYALIDGRGKKLRYARAGGSGPVLFRRGSAPRRLEAKGMAIGLTKASVFGDVLEEEEVDLLPGDLIVLHTHGAISAQNIDQTELGAGRLLDLVQRYGRHEADYFTVKFERFFEAFTQGMPLSEDCTVAAVKLRE